MTGGTLFIYFRKSPHDSIKGSSGGRGHSMVKMAVLMTSSTYQPPQGIMEYWAKEWG